MGVLFGGGGGSGGPDMIAIDNSEKFQHGGNPQDSRKKYGDPLPHQDKGTTCPPVEFTVTGIAPGQAPGTTAISQTPRANIPDGGVAIKPGNFGVSGLNNANRSTFLGMRFTVDWSTASPAGALPGIPTKGPFFSVDNLGPQSVRLAPGNMIDVYNYTSKKQAASSTRTVMITTYIPANTVGVTCPEGN